MTMKEYSLIYRNINMIHLIPCLAKPLTWSDLKTNVKCTSVLNHKQFFTFLQLLVICQPVSFCSFRQSFISLPQKCRSQDLRSQRLINKKCLFFGTALVSLGAPMSSWRNRRIVGQPVLTTSYLRTTYTDDVLVRTGSDIMSRVWTSWDTPDYVF